MSVLCKSTKYAIGKQAGKSFSASVGHADRKALKFTSDSTPTFVFHHSNPQGRAIRGVKRLLIF